MIRLYLPHDLNAGSEAQVAPGQAHYLAHVMRVRAGDEVLAFNGRDGEWLTQVAAISRREARLAAVRQVREQFMGPDVELIVALIKRARLETIVEKAAELGARRVRLVVTERTNADHTNVERLHAIAVEAAEQTGRLDVPEIIAPVKLAAIISAWPADRRLMFCDEAGEAPPILDVLKSATSQPWAILIGPEGGFSPDERAAVRAVAGALPVSLGPRVLRADTAAIAALSLWQGAVGDWRGA
jgi:16S rRNA (uracil1498-N3)-methyltransferase